MGSFKITAVSTDVTEFDSKYGKMKSYKLKISDSNGEDHVVSMNQKGTTPAPEVGSTINGIVDMSGQYGPSFKKEFAPQSSSGGSGGGSSGYVPREDHHEDIKAEWAIGQAIALLTIQHAQDPSSLETDEVEPTARLLLDVLASITLKEEAEPEKADF